MTDAPERIWINITLMYPELYGGVWVSEPCAGYEYIRADLARPVTVAEAAKVLETDLDQLMSLIVAMPIGRHRREALAKVTEIRALSEGVE